MDLATENRIAAILLREAAELRRKADEEGALAYLCKPTIRGRPNSRFLKATVLGIQQANRAVEVNEMWRLRQKELGVDDRKERRLGNENSSPRSLRGVTTSRINDKRHSDCGSISIASCSSKNRDTKDYYLRDEGLQVDEVHEFLHSRPKRGRGAVGARMDETGPYPAACSDHESNPSGGSELRDRPMIGPKKPLWLNSSESSDDEDMMKVSKKGKPDKYHSSKHKSKSKSRDKGRKVHSERHKSHE